MGPGVSSAGHDSASMASRRTPASCAARIMRAPISLVRTLRARPLCASLAITTGACANPHRTRSSTGCQPSIAAVSLFGRFNPRGSRRRRRRCRSDSPGRRPGAGTRAGPGGSGSAAAGTAAGQAPPTRLALARQALARQALARQALARQALAQPEAARQARARRPRAARRRAPGRVRVRGDCCSTAGPSGLSPGTTRRGSTRRIRAAPVPGLSARRPSRRPPARWGPRLARVPWDFPCVHGTQKGLCLHSGRTGGCYGVSAPARLAPLPRSSRTRAARPLTA